MIGIIEDNDGDYAFYAATIFSDINHKRFSLLEDFERCEDTFDCIVLDLNVPDGFGKDMVYRVRSIVDCPIIIMTGTAQQFLTGKGHHSLISAGAHEVFQKMYLNDVFYRELVVKTIMEFCKDEPETEN